MTDVESGLTGKRILLGVTGGIAAYKAVDLVRRLQDRGAEVRVVMTRGARAFVTPLSFQAISGNPVHTDLLDDRAEAAMGHIELARWADRVLVAPASADFMARIAAGLADDLLSTLCLATPAPISLAPAMNQRMWSNPATVDNARRLADRGVQLLGPADGSQACGDIGPGRMLEPLEIVAALDQPKWLSGVRVLVSAGPTFEDLDPVRFLGNRSSGRMGFAVAAAAVEAGADVTLVSGPVQLQTPPGVERIDVRSALEMHQQVMALATAVDVYVGAAAVADFRPVRRAEDKIKKGRSERLTVEFERNPDIVADVSALGSNGPFTVGFAAETTRVGEYARGKLDAKRLDMVAANQVGRERGGFDCDDNELLVLWADGEARIAMKSKRDVARDLVRLIAEHLQQPTRQKAHA